MKILAIMGSPKEALAPMRIALGAAKNVHEPGVGTPPWPVTEKAAAKNDRAVREAAEKLYNARLETALPKPGFNDYVRFVVQQRIGTECKEWLPADYDFYKGKAYYYEAPVSPAVKIAAGVMMRFVFFMDRPHHPGHLAGGQLVASPADLGGHVRRTAAVHPRGGRLP